MIKKIYSTIKAKNIVFICGLGGDAGMTYVPNLKLFCNKRNMRFYAPSMPSFEEGISYQKYVNNFEKFVEHEKINLEETLLIAQSAGTNFAVKYFSKHPFNFKGYISVSGFSKQPDQLLSKNNQKLSVLESFYPTEKEYEIFKNLNFPKFSIYGGKDCFFTKENLKNYAIKIGAKEYFDQNGVHCTISENIKTHSLLHKVIEENF